jgi:tryptophan halogenase
MKGRERGLAGDYGDYCLELKASLESRFAHLPNHGMNYAYHLDAGRYARFLRRFSEHFGVQRIEGKIASVDQARGSGDIAPCCSIRQAHRRRPVHRLHRLPLAAARRDPGRRYEDWSHWLFNDSAIAVQTESVGRPCR